MERNECCGSLLLPVFRQGEPDRHNGYHDCDHIPYTDPATGRPGASELILLETDSGTTELANRKAGNGSDAFRPGTAAVFSPWSNPSSQDKHRMPTGFGFEITGSDSTVHGTVYRLSLYAHTAEHASPAAVQTTEISQTHNGAVLRWQTSEEPDIVSYRVYRVLPSENDADTPVYIRLATVRHKPGSRQHSWTDRTQRGARPDIAYAVSAVDRQGKESVKRTIILK